MPQRPAVPMPMMPACPPKSRCAWLPQPIYMHFLGVEIFGLGFLTSMCFITITGGFLPQVPGGWCCCRGRLASPCPRKVAAPGSQQQNLGCSSSRAARQAGSAARATGAQSAAQTLRHPGLTPRPHPPLPWPPSHAGVFCSSWLGETFIALGEWIIKRLPLIKHIYSASKQVSSAINPENEGSRAFQE
jgi:hypothetical protein